MDAHTHLTEDFSGNYNERRLRELDLNVSEQAIQATEYARVTVEAGFTTVRDLGSRFVGSHEFVDAALRNSINKRVIVGPRMLIATKGIGATGGHFDPTNGFRDFLFGHATARRATDSFRDAAGRHWSRGKSCTRFARSCSRGRERQGGFSHG